jgi:hypothetical protein
MSRSRGPIGNTRAQASALASRLPCEIMAPLGSPVVPLVKTISARSPDWTGPAGSGSARRAASRSDSIQTIGRPSEWAPSAVCLLAKTRRASVWAATRPAKS